MQQEPHFELNIEQWSPNAVFGPRAHYILYIPVYS
jgi:hypothetical protein